MTTPITLKDWRGSDLRVGVNITYPWRRGSSMGIREGEVIAIGEKRRGGWYLRDEVHQYVKVRLKDGGRVRFITRIDRLTVVV